MAQVLRPLKAIRAKCIDCCCGQHKEVRLCTCIDCPLYPYRFGRRPKEEEILEVEQYESKIVTYVQENYEITDDEGY